jgi:signal transduction histidine kinase/HAMP domain-containing protein
MNARSPVDRYGARLLPSGTRRFGITLRIALLAWIITTVTLSIFVTVIIPEQKRAFVENLESKANGVAVSIRGVAAGAVVTEDYGALVEHCLQILKGDKAIDYLVITKNDGESWIHERSGWRYSQLPAEWHPAARVPSSGIGVVTEFHRRVFHYAQPFDYSGIEWGWIHVGLSLETYDRSVTTVYCRTGILALICILLSLLASGLYARLLVKPIRTLQSVVQRIARGDLSARAVIHSGDEVEILANSFNAMTSSLLQRDKILGSVQFASQQFLAASDWRTVAPEVLARIGRAAEISGAHIFENQTGADGVHATGERFEYEASGEAAIIGRSKLRDFPWYGTGLEAWAECLKQGRVFSAVVSKLGPVEQALLVPQRIKSIILVPIHIEGVWWGHLGFNDCASERVWTDAEVDSLRALADMLGAAIARQRAQDALIEAKQTLERRVSERTRELEEQVAAKEKAHAELAEAQQELLVASREAGMAEVATGVLHNVGNVLNSVNVSTTLIREKLQRSGILTLGKLRGLLEQHEADIGAFLTSDPKGKLVPGFLIQLSRSLEKEQAALQEEHEQLALNVEHIKEVVSMQQNYARVSGFLEQVSVSKLLDDALQLNAAGLKRHGITVLRQYSEVPPMTVDKHKVLQILVNLVHNAKYALDESTNGEKRLTVGISINGDERVKITVADNGVGIAPENLTRIFSHGFTTRKHGHGFGLHSGANAAREMGGQLIAFSDGRDRGATFTLELPLTCRRQSL